MKRIFISILIFSMTSILASQDFRVYLRPKKLLYVAGEEILIFWEGKSIHHSAMMEITLWRRGESQSICRIAENVPVPMLISGYKWRIPRICRNPHTFLMENLIHKRLKIRVRWQRHRQMAESHWFGIKARSTPRRELLPDLGASIKCPPYAYPGQELWKNIKVFVWNKGVKGAQNFHLDLVLSSDKTVPVKYASYSPNYHEDVLLQGGREFVSSILSKKTISLTLNGNNKIPDDTPPGYYYIAAVVDPGNAVKELNEKNNVGFCMIKVKEPGLPDLVVDNIKFEPIRRRVENQTVSDCILDITIKNIGYVLPDDAYDSSNGIGIQIWIDGEIRGGTSLYTVDSSRILKSPGGVVSFHWSPGSDNPLIGEGLHMIKVVIVDVGDVVDEASDANNSKTVRLICRSQ